jgi:transcriptional regulator with XRE-family HTH domain
MPRVPDPQLVALGDVVRMQRRMRNLTQEDLGRASGLNPTHITAVERARKDVQFTTMLRLVKGLDMTPSELLAAYEARAAELLDRSE